MKRFFLTIALLAAASGLPTDARAVAGPEVCKALITSIPVTLSAGGRYCVAQDLSTGLASGAAITVAANNVTIDCNGFKIGNLAAGPATGTIGVETGYLNTRVIGCHFRGFFSAFEGSPGHGAWVQGNLIEAAVRSGVYVSGDGFSVLDNRFVDIGGTSMQAIALFIHGRGEVRGNMIDGVTSTGSQANGIVGSGALTIVDNTIRGLAGAEPYMNYGIYLTPAGSLAIIERNRLQAENDSGYAISCSGPTIVRDNSVIGFGATWTNCPDDIGNVRRTTVE